jgi:hypothetical protein
MSIGCLEGDHDISFIIQTTNGSRIKLKFFHITLIQGVDLIGLKFNTINVRIIIGQRERERERERERVTCSPICFIFHKN